MKGCLKSDKIMIRIKYTKQVKNDLPTFFTIFFSFNLFSYFFFWFSKTEISQIIDSSCPLSCLFFEERSLRCPVSYMMIVLHGPPRGRAEHKRAKAALALSGALYRSLLGRKSWSWENSAVLLTFQPDLNYRNDCLPKIKLGYFEIKEEYRKIIIFVLPKNKQLY